MSDIQASAIAADVALANELAEEDIHRPHLSDVQGVHIAPAESTIESFEGETVADALKRTDIPMNFKIERRRELHEKKFPKENLSLMVGVTKRKIILDEKMIALLAVIRNDLSTPEQKKAAIGEFRRFHSIRHLQLLSQRKSYEEQAKVSGKGVAEWKEYDVQVTLARELSAIENFVDMQRRLMVLSNLPEFLDYEIEFFKETFLINNTGNKDLRAAL